MDRQTKWDLRFLRLAMEYSLYSKDPSTKVGAVVTCDVNIQISQGYNGFDKDDPDLEEDYANRDIKYPKMIHAEDNAIKLAKERHGWEDLSGCTLYTFPMQPCSVCTENLIIPNKINRVVSLFPSKDALSRWEESFARSRALLSAHGIELSLYEAVDLFNKRKIYVN